MMRLRGSEGEKLAELSAVASSSGQMFIQHTYYILHTFSGVGRLRCITQREIPKLTTHFHQLQIPRRDEDEGRSLRRLKLKRKTKRCVKDEN